MSKAPQKSAGPVSSMARVRSADERLRGYFVLGREVTAEGFELDLLTITSTQRADLEADICVIVEPQE